MADAVSSQTYQQLQNQLAGVPGTERDAYSALTTLFASYGLQSLAPDILNFLQNGYSSDTITVLLQSSPAYEARFAGNATRVANGLAVLTPAEYLATEASYRQAMLTSGLDPAYQSETQYAQWIGDDISPTEIQNRVNLATQAVVNAPPSYNQALAQLGVSVGDLTSYFLNDKNPMPMLQQKLAQIQIMSAGYTNGLTPNASLAQDFAAEGVTYQQAQAGYAQVAKTLPTAQQLTSIYATQPQLTVPQKLPGVATPGAAGTIPNTGNAPVDMNAGQQAVTQGTLELADIGNNGQAQLAVQQLGAQETAAFSGQGGVNKQSLQQQPQGAPGF